MITEKVEAFQESCGAVMGGVPDAAARRGDDAGDVALSRTDGGQCPEAVRASTRLNDTPKPARSVSSAQEAAFAAAFGLANRNMSATPGAKPGPCEFLL